MEAKAKSKAGSKAKAKSEPKAKATTVVNLKGHRDDPDFADVVYVGRPMKRGGWRLEGSPLSCPYRPGPDGTREQVVARYRAYLLDRPELLALLPGLRGRRLGCWCVPLRCHAQVIAELADAGYGRDGAAGPGREGGQRSER